MTLDALDMRILQDAHRDGGQLHSIVELNGRSSTDGQRSLRQRLAALCEAGLLAHIGRAEASVITSELTDAGRKALNVVPIGSRRAAKAAVIDGPEAA